MRWIFAYGSLLWRPDFPFVERRVAFVRGFERRLEQGSPDHRGTPEQLGRVANLLPSPQGRCGGLVYAVDPHGAPEVLARLDVREQGGYERVEVEAYLREPEGASLRALTWIAPEENPYRLGPAAPEVIAAQVRGARGPSGTNLEYVRRLAESLRALGIEDRHVESVAALLEDGEAR